MQTIKGESKMTLSSSSCARENRTIHAGHGLFRAVIALAALVFLLGSVPRAWGASPGDTNLQEVGASITTPLVWTTQAVNPQHLFLNMGDHSLRLDSTGKVHLAYGGDHLYYATYDGANWSVETVDDEDNVGKFTSLFIDSGDHPHISYYDANHGNLKYARNLGGGWEVYVIARWWMAGEGFLDQSSLTADSGSPEASVDPTDWHFVPGEQNAWGNQQDFTTVITDTKGVGLYTSIALDANGNPYISYYDAVNGDLKCARLVLGSWYVDTVDSDGVTGLYTSIAVDDSSPAKIYISYYDYTNRNLRYAVWNGSHWSRITADATGDVGSYTSLALDNGNKARISYYDATNKDLKYAYWTGSTFVASKVDGSGVDVGKYTSIALKDGKSPNISYYDLTHGRLRYAVLSGTTWTIYTLSTEELSGEYSSIALDPNDNWYPRVTYYSSVTGTLRYVERTGATVWAYSTIDWAHDQGLFSSLALDSTNKPHVAFFDDTTDLLNYASWDGAAWQVEVVDPAISTGLYCALALDASNNPHISYWDSVGHRLKYATKFSGAWHIEYADQKTGVGQYTSIKLDSIGLPYISYYDSGDKNLRLTHKKPNGSWEVLIVDASVGVGKYSSLVLDSNNIPHISYFNETNGNLKYATFVNGQWVKIVIGQNGDNVGLFTSLALDSNGNPHIAYFRDDNDALMYAYFNGTSWVVQRIDFCGAKQEFNISLALDSSNNPYISYVRADSLKVARWTGTEWIRQIVDSPGDVGRYSSIKLLNNGYPVVAYYDATNGDVKYAMAMRGYQTFLPSVRR
jgi:hypothetical protein